MTGKAHPLLGKWRISGMELWDAAFIDLPGPGHIRFDANGGGELAFGAVQGETDGYPGGKSIHFAWKGSNGMDHASGDGDAQLEADGTITGEIRFHRGNETAFTTRRW